MNDEHPVPPLGELFLHIVLFVLPRDSFDCDHRALLRLSRIRKNFVEAMHASSGAFSLDLRLSARHIVMVSPYPCSQLAHIDMQHFRALKSTAARFRSIHVLTINLSQLPPRCNFVNTAQILDLVFHCLTVGRARHLNIFHAVFETDQFTNCMQHLFQCTKNRILSVDLSHCKLLINSRFMRELASMRNLRSLTLDGNRFDVQNLAFPSFSDKLNSLSVMSCSGIRPSFLKKVDKTLQELNWSDNLVADIDKPVFLDWIAGSHVQILDIDNCGFLEDDVHAFQKALERMPALRSVSLAGNYIFQDEMFWWIYEFWKNGRLQSNCLQVYISNMQISYPTCGIPVALSRWGYQEVF